MYCRLGQRGAVNHPAGAHVRLEPVAAHTGRVQDFLRRHERAATEAVRNGTAGLRAIGPALLARVADTRNLRAAWDYLAQHGGQASGRNGHRYKDLESPEVWNLLRTLTSAILAGTYRHGPNRRVRIQKSSGIGHRILTLENIEDRVASRAIVQIIQPLLDPTFSDDSYRFRPGRGREHALLRATQLAATGNLIWVVEDIKDAFDNVPLNRLLDIVELRLPNAAGTRQLIERVISNGTKRGLRQGNCLSPLLLNLYLDHLLDKPWKKTSPNLPLIRTADDLLVTCTTEQEAHDAYCQLQDLLQPTGLRLKGTPDTAIRNLGNGDTADWLGYRTSMSSSGLVVRIGERAWRNLAQSLEEAHLHSGSPLYARETLKGWAGQLGATHPHEDQDQVIARVMEICYGLALDEALQEDHFLECWRAAYARWCRLTQTTPSDASTAPPRSSSSAGGSACHDFSDGDNVPCCDGAPTGAPSLFFSEATAITLFSDGCCDQQCGDGAWAVVIETDGETVNRAGYLPRTTNNRAELLAVIRGLEMISGAGLVRVHSDSQYVIRGITEYLANWKQQGWRTGRPGRWKQLKNADLWRRLDALLMTRHVTCLWVRGHAGHQQNEACDALADVALRRGRRRAAAACS